MWRIAYHHSPARRSKKFAGACGLGCVDTKTRSCEMKEKGEVTRRNPPLTADTILSTKMCQPKMTNIKNGKLNNRRLRPSWPGGVSASASTANWTRSRNCMRKTPEISEASVRRRAARLGYKVGRAYTLFYGGLRPRVFPSLAGVNEALDDIQRHYQRMAEKAGAK